MMESINFRFPVSLWNLEFGLNWFYNISTIVGYLMPNPLYTCNRLQRVIVYRVRN